MEKTKLGLALALVFALIFCAGIFADDESTDVKGEASENAAPAAVTPPTPEAPVTYAVTFNAASGTPATQTKAGISNNGMVTSLPNNPTRTGYHFAGWWTQRDGRGAQFTQSTPVTGNIAVYAKWDIDSYTVTFDMDGGTPTIQPIPTEYNKFLGTNLPENPKKDDHEFQGWITRENGAEKEFTGRTPITKNTRVYAKWKQVESTGTSTTNMTETETSQTGETPSEDQTIEPEGDKSPAPAVIAGVPAVNPAKAQITSLKDDLLFIAAVGALVLLMIAFVLLTLPRLGKLQRQLAAIEKNGEEYKKDNLELKQSVQQLNEKLEAVDRKVRSNTGAEGSRSPADMAALFDGKISDLSRRTGDIEKRLHDQDEERKTAAAMAKGNLDVKEVFNNWASSPLNPLPGAFYFIAGDMNIRTKREIKESVTATMWISNREGIKKYLFPNPGLFNQMTNISVLYKMDQSKLKPRGQNKIRILVPCEMSGEGFVEFPGELEIL